MTREDIIRMANEVGFRGQRKEISLREFVLLARFATLVAETEREACAKIADSANNYANPMTAKDCAEAIRARGQTKADVDEALP